MILSRRVSLGGKQLDEIDEMIVIRKVDPGVAHEAVQAVNRMGGFGQRMTNQHCDPAQAVRHHARRAVPFRDRQAQLLRHDSPLLFQAVSVQQDHDAHLPAAVTVSCTARLLSTFTLTVPGSTYRSSALSGVRRLNTFRLALAVSARIFRIPSVPW